jgi:hypothetical protein
MVTLQTALFSSIVASFIIEIYKTLLPGNSQQSPDSPRSTAVRINIVLFISLFLSIVSALSCALIQQWCYEYLKFAYPRAAPHERGRVRTYLHQGLDQFQMRRFMYGTHVLLHISVFLFFWAISDFFYTVDHLFGVAARYSLVGTVIVYMLLSISPLIFSNSPYNTPMTPPLRATFIILRIIIRSPLLCLRWYRNQPFDLIGLKYYKGIHFDRAHLYLMEAKKRAEKLESYAMEWLFTEGNFSDDEMDKFLEGLPGYMSSRQTEKGQLDQYLTANHILSRIKEHLMTCPTSVELSDETIISRVSSCVKALRHIFRYSHKRKETSPVPDELKNMLQSQKAYTQGLIDDFQTLCGTDEATIALRASCIRALTVQDFLSQLDPPGGRSTDSPPFPASLIPMYKFFFPNDNTDTIRQPDDGHTSSPADTILNGLLHDGPLANLTMFAQDVRKREDALPSTLSFCWKALDMLLTRLGTIHSDNPTHVQSDFDNLHKNIRTYVHTERGFRVAPLLDILDTVARGRRLLMVFSGHPKYHNRADVVFGKEYLRNDDLLEAFAHCLPDFISKTSLNVCRDFMEKVVCEDHLWTSLQISIWNNQKSDKPIPDKLRVFENCCIVIDIAFSVLEDSEKVDWRAPEFGSLAQPFESFIAHCFQGGFMGRATSFRVGVIKVRFCKAVLAQFSNDKHRRGTVSFQSQWDVASLARVIYTLGLQDKDDPEFWNFYVDGGHIGADFMTKALEMIDIAARDGPLLILCQLGHLIATAVPLDQSGLQHEDIEKVLELQRKVVEDECLPLHHASDIVWEELSRLRIQVNDLCGKNTGKDIEILRRLLQMINDASNHRFSGPESPIQSEPAEEQGSNTSAALNPTSFSGESPGISNRISFASESTLVAGGPSNGTRMIEGEDSFGLGSALLLPRAHIDLQPVSGSPGLSSPPPTVQGAPTGDAGIIDRSARRSSLTLQPVVPYMYMGDARQRRAYTHTTQDNTRRASSSSRFFFTRSSISASTTSPIDAPSTVLPNPANESLDLSGEDQSGTYLTSEPEELEEGII